jgi:N-formylglutamate deformylase
MSWEITQGDARSPVIIHVPHASTFIPEHIMSQLLLNGDELQEELGLITDSLTNQLAQLACELSQLKPWIFENKLSRLVFDPERFPDETEVMNQVGMGVVYTKTSDLKPLRHISEAESAAIVDHYFKPYSSAFQELVTERLEAIDRVVIVDLHSYPLQASEYELFKESPRPELCLGVDDFHTPNWLIKLVKEAFSEWGSIDVNTPFVGTYVPLAYYSKDPRVLSTMLELRRDTYLAGLSPGLGFGPTSSAIGQLIDSISAYLGVRPSKSRGR